MWFIYLLSWLSLVIQISFVTLAIGKPPSESLQTPGICLLIMLMKLAIKVATFNIANGTFLAYYDSRVCESVSVSVK